MDRKRVAVENSPSLEGARLELAVRANGGGALGFFPPELLHDEVTASFARVLRGRISCGPGMGWDVAVKLQRDLPTAVKDFRAADAKFVAEHDILQRIQADSSNGRSHDHPFVRLYKWDTTTPRVDTLLPTILCRSARFGLPLLCPNCQETELHDDPGISEVTERRLICSKCQAEKRDQFAFRAHHCEAIVGASVQKAGPCDGCEAYGKPELKGVCMKQAGVLNFFPARLLLLELLDGSLEEYIDSGNLAPQGATSRQQMFHAHFRRRMFQGTWPPADRPTMWWMCELTSMFDEVVGAVDALHRREIVHLDLKPANICVRVDGPHRVIRLIDFGLTDDPRTEVSLRQAGGLLAAEGAYAAPEVRDRAPVAEHVGQIRLGPDGKRLRFTCTKNAKEQFDPPYPGDLVEFSEPDELAGSSFRIVDVAAAEETLVLDIIPTEPGLFWKGTESVVREPAWSPPQSGTLTWRKHCGVAADLYSLGMILLRMLTSDATVRLYAQGAANLQRWFQQANASYLGSLTGRNLVLELDIQAKKNQLIGEFHTVYKEVQRRWPDSSLVSMELLAIVLRATVRGPQPLCYLGHRGDQLVNHGPAPLTVLELMREQVAALAKVASAALADVQARARQQSRMAALNKFETDLDNRPIPANAGNRPSAVLSDIDALATVDLLTAEGSRFEDELKSASHLHKDSRDHLLRGLRTVLSSGSEQDLIDESLDRLLKFNGMDFSRKLINALRLPETSALAPLRNQIQQSRRGMQFLSQFIKGCDALVASTEQEGTGDTIRVTRKLFGELIEICPPDIVGYLTRHPLAGEQLFVKCDAAFNAAMNAWSGSRSWLHTKLVELKINPLLEKMVVMRWRNIAEQHKDWAGNWRLHFERPLKYLKSANLLIIDRVKDLLAQRRWWGMYPNSVKLTFSQHERTALSARGALKSMQWLQKNCDGPAWHLTAEMIILNLLEQKSGPLAPVLGGEG